MADREPGGAVVEAAGELARGRVVVLLTDGEDGVPARGQLLVAAARVTEETVAFLLQHTSGLLYAGVTGMRARWLLLDPMVTPAPGPEAGPQQLVAVDYRHGTTTGISAGDRAATLRALADPGIRPSDLTRPGHVIPVVAHEDGVAGRPGPVEAAVELCAVSGTVPVVVLASLVTPDRLELLRGQAVRAFAARHGLAWVAVSAVVARRRDLQRRIQRSGDALIPRVGGDVAVVAYRDVASGTEHLAVVRGDVATAEPVAVVVHRECVSADAVRSTSCGCAGRLEVGLDAVQAAGRGVLVYLRGAEGQGTGVSHPAPVGEDAAATEVVGEILRDLGVRHRVAV